MDVLTVGSKNYVKASVLARDLGYTADYVGQLCRSGKVEAKLFGRSWYVEEDSIKDHKDNRYRTTTAKSVKAIREVEVDDQVAVLPVSIKKEQHFYIHNSLKASPRYTEDSAELLPEIGKAQKMKGNLRVDLADSSPVKISSESEKYVFDTPKIPVIKFKGSLTVTESENSTAPEGGLLLHPKEVTQLAGEKKANNKVISTTKKPKSAGKTTKIIPTDTDPDVVTKVVFSAVDGSDGKKFPLSIVFSAAVSFSCAILLLGLESHVNVVEMSQVTEYVFRINHLLASVYSAF